MSTYETEIERDGKTMKIEVTYSYEPPQRGGLFTETISEAVLIDQARIIDTEKDIDLTDDECAVLSDEILNHLTEGD